MADDRYEPNRVLGMPVGDLSRLRPGEEQQRVLGFPVDSFGPADRDRFHPIRAFKRWARRVRS